MREDDWLSVKPAESLLKLHVELVICSPECGLKGAHWLAPHGPFQHKESISLAWLLRLFKSILICIEQLMEASDGMYQSSMHCYEIQPASTIGSFYQPESAKCSYLGFPRGCCEPSGAYHCYKDGCKT